MRLRIGKIAGWKGVVSLIAATVFLLCERGSAEPSREARVEAAFIYNFTQFVEWPAEALGPKDAPFVVAVIGEDALGGALEQAMAGKAVDGRPIVVRHFPSADQIQPCQLLFLPVNQDGASEAVMARVGHKAVLTVGEGEAIMPAGGSIRLFLEEGKMKFQLCPEALEASKLKASAKLMKLARIYRK